MRKKILWLIAFTMIAGIMLVASKVTVAETELEVKEFSWFWQEEGVGTDNPKGRWRHKNSDGWRHDVGDYKAGTQNSTKRGYVCNLCNSDAIPPSGDVYTPYTDASTTATPSPTPTPVPIDSPADDEQLETEETQAGETVAPATATPTPTGECSAGGSHGDFYYAPIENDAINHAKFCGKCREQVGTESHRFSSWQKYNDSDGTEWHKATCRIAGCLYETKHKASEKDRRCTICYPNKKDGWVQDGSNWYYYKDNKKQTGWIKVDEKWYYLNPNTSSHEMVTGSQEIKGEWYYFDKDGHWVKDGAPTTAPVESPAYTVDETGTVVTGTINIIWNDINNQAGKRPNRVYVGVYKNGAWAGGVDINESQGWKFDVTPGAYWLAEENGQKNIWTLQYDDVIPSGYTVDVQGWNVIFNYEGVSGKVSDSIADPSTCTHSSYIMKYDHTSHWKVCLLCNTAFDGAVHGKVQTFDKYSHWEVCPDCFCIIEGSAERHTGTANCTKCGWTSAATEVAACTTHNMVWTKDSVAHWKVCTVCSYVDESTAELHTWSDTITEGNAQWQRCTNSECGAINVLSGNHIVLSATTLGSSNLGASISGLEGIIPVGAEIDAKKVANGTVYNNIVAKMPDNTKAYEVYKIGLTQNGQTLTPKGPVQVLLTIPEGYNKEKISVYEISDDGTEVKEYYPTVIGNKVSLETEKLAYFAISTTEVADIGKIIPDGPGVIPTQTDKIQNGNSFPIAIFVVIATIVAGVIIFFIAKTLRVKVKIINK